MDKSIYNFENRTIVLEMSVTIEDMLSLLLSFILEIQNRHQSLSLGTKSSGLGFNAKANLLLDMKYFEQENRWKFQIFMEIRNQFAHNLKVETFAQCFKTVGGKKKLMKTYPGKETLQSEEEQLKNAVIELGFEIIHLCQKVIQIYSEEYRREKLLEVLTVAIVSFVSTFKNIPSHLKNENDLKEFLETFVKVLPEESKKAHAFTTQEKNEMIKKLFPDINIPDLIHSRSMNDYFSPEEINRLSLKQADEKVNLSF